jgi:phenylacetate-CoA ligase
VSEIETAPREAIARAQVARVQRLLAEVLASNPFYRVKLRGAGLEDARDVTSLDDLVRLPLTQKQELVDDQEAHPPFGTNLTYPLRQYTRVHQTSGTMGKPLRWLDTRDSWDWWSRCWGTVYRAADVNDGDRVFFAFSFGPFIGFWAAFAGAERMGSMALTGGAQDSRQRLSSLLDLGATVLCCTPSYALHLAGVAATEGIDLRHSAIARIIVAGEPGGSIPSTRERIESAWGAALFDHAGATEIGAHSFMCAAHSGLHINEGEFIAEVIDPVSGASTDDGELVLTNLGRVGSPVIRYRTGDRVRLNRAVCGCGRTFARMDGGIIGRIDQMLIVRGVNIFPSAIEAIVRSHRDVDEFGIDVDRIDEMDELTISVEVRGPSPLAIAEKIATECRERLSLRARVLVVPDQSLPRFELKARRVVDRRG